MVAVKQKEDGRFTLTGPGWVPLVALAGISGGGAGSVSSLVAGGRGGVPAAGGADLGRHVEEWQRARAEIEARREERIHKCQDRWTPSTGSSST
jgi:hypothetical protein